MKPVFKCDYCKFIGTKEEVEKHESECRDDYTKKSCYTCKSRKTFLNPKLRFGCEKGQEIPEGCIIENCSVYERKEKDNMNASEILGSFFGGM